MKELKNLTNQEKIWIAFYFDLLIYINGRTANVVAFARNKGSEVKPENIEDFEVQYLYRSNPKEDKLTETFEIIDNLTIEFV